MNGPGIRSLDDRFTFAEDLDRWAHQQERFEDFFDDEEPEEEDADE